MTPEFILIMQGVAIGAIPFCILYAMANRRARDWRDLCNRAMHETDRAHQGTHNIYAQYLRLLAVHKQQQWDGHTEEGESWKDDL